MSQEKVRPGAGQQFIKDGNGLWVPQDTVELVVSKAGNGFHPDGHKPPSEAAEKASAREVLEQSVREPQHAALGEVVLNTSIESCESPFKVLPGYRTEYPTAVKQGLVDMYHQYNEAFRPLVAANREWDTDYQYCTGQDGMPLNRWVQIDMVGLPERFLQAAPGMNEDAVREAMRGKIFELENSLAMYQLMENIFRQPGEGQTRFDKRFRDSLDEVREQYGKPVALLAVTDEKYQAMKESEFGKMGDEPVTDEDVHRLSGFDKFFGPEEFQEHIRKNGGKSDYLLFARTSDPVSKLRKPGTAVSVPLLESDDTRRIIKANAITFNVDNPAWPTGSPAAINDTKEYLAPIGMGFNIQTESDLFSTDFQDYLIANGADPDLARSHNARVVAKPMKASYGGYGQQKSEVSDRKFRSDLRRGLRERGPYVAQPEMKTPVVTNDTTGISYTYIDRNFLSTTDGQNYTFMGGFRSLMPLATREAERGRVHGNSETVWTEVY